MQTRATFRFSQTAQAHSMPRQPTLAGQEGEGMKKSKLDQVLFSLFVSATIGFVLSLGDFDPAIVFMGLNFAVGAGQGWGRTRGQVK